MYRQQINLTGKIREEKGIKDYLKIFFPYHKNQKNKILLSDEGNVINNGIKFREIIFQYKACSC